MQKVYSIFLIIVSQCFLFNQLSADTGPIQELTSDIEIIDSFEADLHEFGVWTHGEVEPSISRTANQAKDGEASLVVEVQPTEVPGRNSVLLDWSLSDTDWEEWDGLSFWITSTGTVAPNVTAVLTEKGGAEYWMKADDLLALVSG
ncbi:carbohydrate binding domain-containing protein [Thiorhodovibrio litoralis]|uniref:carbohydrate binding domain-containing protein n=1 Tax=Thiorhodovibrio litoralis TaxID=2952932 RepID=UPI002B261A0B|nr:carbohydrate binding domain-containing protein [Thiorhodovibrio litoralis]WPL11551.1 hypothetical protein Thiosp_01300 [Thiorhodovibrio litoralis]